MKVYAFVTSEPTSGAYLVVREIYASRELAEAAKNLAEVVSLTPRTRREIIKIVEYELIESSSSGPVEQSEGYW